MQTLVFNTTTKTIRLYEGPVDTGKILTEMYNIPTVKVLEGYYEVRQMDEFEKQIPVLRLPITNTNMFIKK
jgi:membrane carboxypeptidase/penicillin-binding protein PbpC